MRARKAHSLIAQVYDPRNLERAWEKVKQNNGCAGVDGMTIARFDEDREHYLAVLHQKLKDGTYRPRPVLRVEIDKPGSTKRRPLGIPTILDRVCQQALAQVLAPIFEPTFSEASFGYRPGRSVHMALDRVKADLEQGAQWIVDGDLADFFGTLSHELLVDKVAERVADTRVLGLIRAFLTAGVLIDGSFEPTIAGVPQGGVASPLLSNIYLHLFDEKMVEAGFALTRWADDWVVICRSRSEAERALTSACRVLEEDLRLRLHARKTRIVHLTQGFEFLGFVLKRGRGLPRAGRAPGIAPSLYLIPTPRSVERFKKKVRRITRRKNGKSLRATLDDLNPVIRGWGNFYRHANVRTQFNKLNNWILRRIWSHQFGRWRNAGWSRLPARRLYRQLGLVNLLMLLPSMQPYYRQKGYLR
jgi:RNA-directed DNA polymerase